MTQPTRGFSLIGMLVTLVCILVLFTISMNALNRAVTGEGSARPGTVRSTQDMIHLRGLHTAMIVAGNDTRDARLPVASQLAGRNDWSLNTTANIYSAMIAGNYVTPEMLVSGNEYNPRVYVMNNYDYAAYAPGSGVFWDDAFQADLDRESHVSFAHMPLFGERYEKGWQANLNRQAVLAGNRGPKDGIDDPQSFTYGRSGQWGGHVLHGDGSINFHSTFTPEGLIYQRAGERHTDNLFAMDDGPDGVDAILSFTQEMTPEGPTLQHD